MKANSRCECQSRFHTILNQLKITPLQERIKFRISSLIYRILHQDMLKSLPSSTADALDRRLAKICPFPIINLMLEDTH